MFKLITLSEVDEKMIIFFIRNQFFECASLNFLPLPDQRKFNVVIFEKIPPLCDVKILVECCKLKKNDDFKFMGRAFFLQETKQFKVSDLMNEIAKPIIKVSYVLPLKA